MTCQLTEKDISVVLERFYARVRVDDQLGPVFGVVQDWDEHMVRLNEFWSSMMLTTGSYKGNPLSMHLVHAEKFRPAMFNRWLELWRLTTDELVSKEAARDMQARAARIASRFSMMICGEDLPTVDVPPSSAPIAYRTSPTFDETSLPRALLTSHRLKPGTWGVVRIEEGQIRYRENGLSGIRVLSPGSPGVVPPAIDHNLELSGPVRLRVEFYDRNPQGNLQN